jgi:hypothetical protein
MRRQSLIFVLLGVIVGRAGGHEFNVVDYTLAGDLGVVQRASGAERDGAGDGIQAVG